MHNTATNCENVCRIHAVGFHLRCRVVQDLRHDGHRQRFTLSNSVPQSPVNLILLRAYVVSFNVVQFIPSSCWENLCCIHLQSGLASQV